MLLINCKVHLELNQIEECILSSAGDSAKFEITDDKLHVPIITLSTKENVNLTKKIRHGFKRSVYQHNYQAIPTKVIINETNIYESLSASFQGVKRLFVFAYDATDDNEAGIKDNKKYFLPAVKIENYKVLIDEKKLYDQPINALIKQYDEIKKVSTGQGDDYATGCLLDYAYFEDNHKLIAVDLSKQKALDTVPRAIQQIVLQWKAGKKLRLYTTLEKSKEAVLEFYKGTAKVL